MKYTVNEIKYERVFNLGDYRSEKIGLSAAIDDVEGATPEEVIEELRSLVENSSKQGKAAKAKKRPAQAKS